MKKILILCTVIVVTLFGLSACANKPKPEATVVAFLEDMKSEEETQYRDYFSSEVSYFEPAEEDPENPMMSQEVEDRIEELGVQFTYVIKTIEKSEDGDIALVTVDLVTFDMEKIMDDFVDALMTKASEMAQNGATEEEVMAIIAPTLLEAIEDAKIERHSTADVRLSYDAEAKRWWIDGSETNVEFIDALYGGYLTAVKYYEGLFQIE